MRQLRDVTVSLANRFSLLGIAGAVLALNVAWTVILSAYGAHFQQVAGVPLLDLQNDLGPGRWITPQQVVTQIAGYSQEVKALYWPFFILDNVMPQMAFGSFALLWAALLRDKSAPLARRLLGSTFILLPLGVGLFDWLENLCYVTAIHGAPGQMGGVIFAGLTFKWIKAAFLFPTFLLTLPLLAYHLSVIWRRAPRRTA